MAVSAWRSRDVRRSHGRVLRRRRPEISRGVVPRPPVACVGKRARLAPLPARRRGDHECPWRDRPRRGHAAQLRKKWLGPVTRIHFPTYAKHWIDDDEAGAPPRRDSLTLLTLGYINPNKQVHRVIEAIERDAALRSSVRYVVAGPTEVEGSYFQSIERLVATKALEGIVTLLPGYQPEAVVEEWLRRADVYVNLREPSLESASASLMRQLPRGKAVLVSNSGFYAEFEDDVLMKVAPGDDAALRRTLRRLVDDDELRRALGTRAREVARDAHGPACCSRHPHLPAGGHRVVATAASSR